MNEQEKEQVCNIINNFLDLKGYFPFLVDLETHETFGPIFKNLDKEKKVVIEKIIDECVVEKIKSYKTKGGELFRRYFEVNEDDFWKFRDMNCNENFAQTKEFQELGKKVEREIFKYEGILTEKMLDQEKGLDKVVGSFYNIVYSYFPKLS
ncbi:MAG TPA: hypothetical protein VJ892_03630, partial [Candidatus Absconditabacterales bacterium]|nr:hypothetical protein [Candidatus Absconditabacterales bacterium]